MKSKVVSREEIISRFHDGQVIGIGGQAEHAAPNRLIDCLIESGAKDLTIVSLDTAQPHITVGRIIHTGRVRKLITTYIGRNMDTVALYNSGKLEVELNPMGTLVERMRCGGMGIGGFLTKTGLGTVVEQNRQVIEYGGEKYLLEPALRVDVALTLARRADPMGNLAYRGTSMNSNPIWVTAGDLSIVETDHLLEVGELPVDDIRVPGVFVDLILA